MSRKETQSLVPSFLRSPGAFRSLPFGLFILLMALEPILESILPAGFDLRWLYGVRSALALVLLLILWRRFEELRAAPRASPIEWGLGGGVGILVFVLWIFLDFPPLALEAKEGFDPTVDSRISLALAAMRLGGAVLVVPVMEELFWRSFILRYLAGANFLKVDPRTVGWMPFLVSSAVFASEHRLWFAGFLAGLAYAWLYKRSGNLWIPILAHAVTNALLGAWVLWTASWWFW